MGLEAASEKRLLTNLKAIVLGFLGLFTDLKKLVLLQRYSCLSKEHVAFLTSWDHVASETAVFLHSAFGHSRFGGDMI